MKTRLFIYGKSLAFSFRTKDLQTSIDKLAVCRLIDHLYHMNCLMTTFSEEELDELVVEAGFKHLGVSVIDQELIYFNATPYLKKYDEINARLLTEQGFSKLAKCN